MSTTPSVQRRVPLAAIGVALVLALVIGALVGGVLDYRAWHAVAAFEATLPVLVAIVVAVVAGIRWMTRRGPLAGLVALAAIAFIVGFRIGAWVAPSAHPPDWSSGTVSLELLDPALGVATGPASCSMASGGSFSVGTDSMQPLGGTTVRYYLSGPGPTDEVGRYFELFTGPEGGTGPRWDTNVEGNSMLDVRIDGQATSGRAELVSIPRALDAPDEGGFAGVVPEAISGVVTWTCEPPRGEPTPIDGSWFG